MSEVEKSLKLDKVKEEFLKSFNKAKKLADPKDLQQTYADIDKINRKDPDAQDSEEDSEDSYESEITAEYQSLGNYSSVDLDDPKFLVYFSNQVWVTDMFILLLGAKGERKLIRDLFVATTFDEVFKNLDQDDDA